MSVACPSSAAAGRAVDGLYATLFSVAFEHEHFNAVGGRCPGLSVSPTPATAMRMRSLGMIFKDQRTGFSVLIEQAKVGALLAWLAGRTRSEGPEQGCWAWLSFAITATDPRFLSISNLPIDTDPLTQKLHVSNLQTVMPGATIALGSTGGIDGAALYPAARSRLSVATPAGTTATLADLSGAAVTVPGGASEEQNWFDLSALGDGFYTVRLADADGAPVDADPSTGYVHLPSRPGALMLLDLLIAQPLAGVGDPSAFPVSAFGSVSSGPPTVTPVSLVVPFRARETFWHYYIVSQGTRGALSADLAIAGDGATFVKSTEDLPNGDQAVVFAAQAALPLQQLSPYRFSLSGRRQSPGGGRDTISVARLPTAPAVPVWPAPSGDALTGNSEIYVYV